MTDLLAASPALRAFALALVEFVWQGAAIGAVCALILTLLRRARPQLRYVVACLGLAAMTLAPVVTAAGYLRTGSNSTNGSRTAATPSVDTSPVTASDRSAAAAAPVAPRTRLTSWLEPRLPMLMAIWIAGVLVMAAHLVAGWLRVTRIRRGATPLDPGRWPSRVLAMARQFRVTRRVRLLVTHAVDVPAVVGYIRPAILVPASALAGLSPDHLEAILLHELAHVRRADYLVNVVQCVVEVLLFYHPAVWWLSSQVRREREHCCDDIAASLCADQVTYARALTSLEELRIPMPRLAVGADGGDLLARIRRLIEPERVSNSRLSGGLVMGVVFTLVLLVLNVPITSSTGVSPAPQAIAQPPATAQPQEVTRTAVDAAPAVQAVAPRLAGIPLPKATTAALPVAVEIDGRAFVVGQSRSGTAGIGGVVRDTDGGVMPGVTIALARDSETSYSSTTNARGEFGIANVPAGAYDMTVTLRGFRTGRSRIELPPGETRRFDVHLKVGSLMETITVGSPYTELSAAASQQVPANPQTAEEHLEVARSLFAQRRHEEGSKHVDRALELLRGEARASTIEEAQPTVEGGPIRVGGSIREPRKLSHVSPIYPAEALAANLQGIVILDAVIATDGTVRDVSVLRGVPVFDQSAVDAVQQWKFTPTFLNGKPVEVTMTITVHFSR